MRRDIGKEGIIQNVIPLACSRQNDDGIRSELFLYTWRIAALPFSVLKFVRHCLRDKGFPIVFCSPRELLLVTDDFWALSREGHRWSKR